MTKGRIPAGTWQELTGLPHLPVLLGGGALAKLIATHEHVVDHRREVGTILAATRRLAWIVDGRRLVKGVVKQCMPCRLER